MKRKDSQRELKTGSQILRIKAADDEGKFEGYGSVFGNADYYGDILAPGAFNESLAEHKKAGTMPALLWQHDPGKPVGVYTSMREDEKGLYVKGQLALETQLGKEAYTLLKMGALDGLSIGFRTRAYERDEEADTWTLTDVELWEVSLVTFPANPDARVDGVKSMLAEADRLADIERHLREVFGATQQEATAIVAKCKELDRKHREGAQARSELNGRITRLQTLLET